MSCRVAVRVLVAVALGRPERPRLSPISGPSSHSLCDSSRSTGLWERDLLTFAKCSLKYQPLTSQQADLVRIFKSPLQGFQFINKPQTIVYVHINPASLNQSRILGPGATITQLFQGYEHRLAVVSCRFLDLAYLRNLSTMYIIWFVGSTYFTCIQLPVIHGIFPTSQTMDRDRNSGIYIDKEAATA